MKMYLHGSQKWVAFSTKVVRYGYFAQSFI